MKILNGLKGLLESRKGTLSIIILTAITLLAAFSKLDGAAYAAVMASVQAIFCFTQSKTDQQAMAMGQSATPSAGTVQTVTTSSTVVTPPSPDDSLVASVRQTINADPVVPNIPDATK